MWLRANVVLAVAVVFAVVQMFASVTGGPRFGDSGTVVSAPDPGLSRSVAAQEEDDDDDDDDDDEEEDDDDDDDDDEEDDDDDDDDDDDEDDEDNDDGDNDDDDDNDDSDNDDCDDDDENAEDEDDDNVDCDDEDEDNDDGDNDDEDEDNDEEEEDDVTTTPSVAQSVPPCRSDQGAPPARGSTTEVHGRTNGRDMLLALPGGRLSVQVFSSMPSGVCLKLRLVDALDHPAAPGVRVGNYIFQLDAVDEFGSELTTLPAEVTLQINYTNTEVAGLTETSLTISRLDPFDQSWKIVPSVFVDPVSNWLWVSVFDTGLYVAHQP